MSEKIKIEISEKDAQHLLNMMAVGTEQGCVFSTREFYVEEKITKQIQKQAPKLKQQIYE